MSIWDMGIYTWWSRNLETIHAFSIDWWIYLSALMFEAATWHLEDSCVCMYTSSIQYNQVKYVEWGRARSSLHISVADGEDNAYVSEYNIIPSMWLYTVHIKQSIWLHTVRTNCTSPLKELSFPLHLSSSLSLIHSHLRMIQTRPPQTRITNKQATSTRLIPLIPITQSMMWYDPTPWFRGTVRWFQQE